MYTLVNCLKKVGGFHYANMNEHTSLGLHGHLHFFLDETYDLYITSNCAIQHSLKDVVMQISHDHRCDDVLVSFREARAMD
jgi:hypothetical protein